MVKTWVLRQGIKVLSLVEELRSHLPCGPKKTLKMVHGQWSLLKRDHFLS